MSATIPFVKAHACGNDFLIVDEQHARGDHASLARRLCARNTGVGADGVEFVDGHTLRLFNSDGSEAELSGNGTRCVAAWLAHQSGSTEVVLNTAGGPRSCRVISARDRAFEIETAMGVPVVMESEVPFPDGRRIEGAEVDTGNPHFVIFVESEDWSAMGQGWLQLGAEISRSRLFPNGTNVEFVKLVAPDQIEIRIFERGAGPTTSSGTGTTASGAAAIQLQGVRSPLRVNAPGGTQTVVWAGRGSELLLTGPAEIIARGEAWL